MAPPASTAAPMIATIADSEPELGRIGAPTPTQNVPTYEESSVPAPIQNPSAGTLCVKSAARFPSASAEQ